MTNKPKDKTCGSCRWWEGSSDSEWADCDAIRFHRNYEVRVYQAHGINKFEMRKTFGCIHHEPKGDDDE